LRAEALVVEEGSERCWGLCAWVVATVGVAALDRGVRGGGGACLIEEGVVGSCDCWVGGAAAVCFF